MTDSDEYGDVVSDNPYRALSDEDVWHEIERILRSLPAPFTGLLRPSQIETMYGQATDVLEIAFERQNVELFYRALRAMIDLTSAALAAPPAKGLP